MIPLYLNGVLDGDTVSYGSALDLRETLEYDLSRERSFYGRKCGQSSE